MPDPLTTAIVTSVIGSAINGARDRSAAPPPQMGVVRLLPEEAKFGDMQPPVRWQVDIDGRTYALSPGVLIRNELNMLIMPTMVQQPARVRYLTDPVGAISRIWILSGAEARQPERR